MTAPARLARVDDAASPHRAGDAGEREGVPRRGQRDDAALGIEGGRAGWVYSTYITPDTEALNARANEALLDAAKQYAKEAARFDGVTVPAG